MVELKLLKESLFLNVLEAILDLVDVASVYCSSTGLKLQAVDTKHVAVITLLFPPEVFQHYHCDRDLSMGIPVDNLVKAIRSADKDDAITIIFDEYNFDTITLQIDSANENITMDYDLQLVDANSQRYHIPNWQDLDSKYQAFVQMPSAEFMRVCKYLSNVGGDVHISVTERGLTFFASGKSGFVRINYMQPEATATVVTMQAPVSVTLDLKYMNSFAKVCALFNQVKICLSETQPLMGECKIGEMGYIRYFLAPKVNPEIEEEEIKQIKRSKRNDKDEGSAEEKEGSKEIKGSGEEKEGSKESEDEGIKERERDRRGKGGDPKRKQRSNRMKRRSKTSGGKQKRCGCQVLVFN